MQYLHGNVHRPQGFAMSTYILPPVPREHSRTESWSNALSALQTSVHDSTRRISRTDARLQSAGVDRALQFRSFEHHRIRRLMSTPSDKITRRLLLRLQESDVHFMSLSKPQFAQDVRLKPSSRRHETSNNSGDRSTGDMV